MCKKRHVLAIGIVVLAVVGAVAASRFVLPPVLVVADSIDLGEVLPNQVIERALRIENRGWGRLRIHKMEGCCGCSVATQSPMEIAPRSEAFVVVRARTPNGYGSFQTKLMVTTNDPSRPAVTVAMRGEPSRSFRITPSSLQLGYVTAGTSMAQTVAVFAQSKDPIVVRTSAPYLSAELKSQGQDGSFAINLRVAENAPRGELNEYLLVSRGSGSQPAVLPISAVVERGIRVRPERVSFGAVGEGDDLLRTVRLEIIQPEWRSVEIQDVDQRCIRAELRRESEGRCSLRIMLDPSTMPAVLRSTIKVRAGSGDSISIPVVAARRSGTGNAATGM